MSNTRGLSDELAQVLLLLTNPTTDNHTSIMYQIDNDSLYIESSKHYDSEQGLLLGAKPATDNQKSNFDDIETF